MASGVGGKPSKVMASVIAQLEKSGAAQKMQQSAATAVTSKPFVPNLKPTNVAGGPTAPPKIALKPPGSSGDKPSPGVKKTTSLKPTANEVWS